MRYVVNPRGVSNIRVFYRAFGDASTETWIDRHATFSFPRRRGKSLYNEARENGVGIGDIESSGEVFRVCLDA